MEVRLPTLLRPAAAGSAKVQVDGDTVAEVLHSLELAFPSLAGQVLTEEGSLHRFVNVYVDDDDVRYLEGLDTKVPPHSVISILPAVAGGS